MKIKIGSKIISFHENGLDLSREMVLASSMARSSCITFSPVYPPPQLRARARSLPAEEKNLFLSLFSPSFIICLSLSLFSPSFIICLSLSLFSSSFIICLSLSLSLPHQFPVEARHKEEWSTPKLPSSPAELTGPNQTCRLPHRPSI